MIIILGNKGIIQGNTMDMGKFNSIHHIDPFQPTIRRKRTSNNGRVCPYYILPTHLSLTIPLSGDPWPMTTQRGIVSQLIIIRASNICTPHAVNRVHTMINKYVNLFSRLCVINHWFHDTKNRLWPNSIAEYVIVINLINPLLDINLWSSLPALVSIHHCTALILKC